MLYVEREVSEIRERNTPRRGKKKYLDAEDEEYILKLLKLHPHYEEKAGVGIKHIFVQWYTMGIHYPQTPVFFIERVDGSTVDFSLRNVFKKIRGINESFDLNRELRKAIRDQTLAYKQEYFVRSGLDQITGEPISLLTSKVKHIDPCFEDLVERFLYDEEIERDQITYLSDDLIKKFQRYHMENAHMLVISK